MGQCKINMDGGVAKTANRGAAAAVCRSADGVYLGASAVVIDGLTHPGSLEAIACREALALAADLHERTTMIASDCMEVIQGLQQENLGLFSSVLREINIDTMSRGGLSFRHEGQDSNKEAHSLARTATSLSPGRHVWLSNPPEGLNFPATIVTPRI